MLRKLVILLCTAAAGASAAQYVVGSAETSVKAPFSAC
jgi:hypothetical protein